MKSLPLILLAAFLVGCGYRPLGAGGAADQPLGFTTITIGALKNRTLRPNIQPALKEALLRRFAADARIKIVDGGGDVVLEGSIDAFGEDPLAFDAADTASRYRLNIYFSFTLKDRVKDQVLRRENVAGVAFYVAGSGVTATRAAEDEATMRAVTNLAEQVVNRVVDGI